MREEANHDRDAGSANELSVFDRELLQRLTEATRPYSYAEISRLTNFHRETCRRYLTLGKPPIEFVTGLCEALGVSLHWLLLGVGPIRRDSGAKDWLRAVNLSELLLELGRRWHGVETTLREVHERVARLEAEAASGRATKHPRRAVAVRGRR